MTEPLSAFRDISRKTFVIPDEKLEDGILGPLVHERGTRSFGNRMYDAGYRTCKDLCGISTESLLRKVPTTRANFDKVLYYFHFAGIRIT